MESKGIIRVVLLFKTQLKMRLICFTAGCNGCAWILLNGTGIEE